LLAAVAFFPDLPDLFAVDEDFVVATGFFLCGDGVDG
jgi:hypothetical protein